MLRVIVAQVDVQLGAESALDHAARPRGGRAASRLQITGMMQSASMCFASSALSNSYLQLSFAPLVPVPEALTT
eukprot:2235022-Prymnesium_polylepis.1